MQWIIEHSHYLVIAAGSALMSGVGIYWQLTQHYQRIKEAYEQQARNEQQLLQQALLQVEKQHQHAQQELEQLDQARDKAEYDAKHWHTQSAVLTEKLRHVSAAQQEYQTMQERMEQLRAQNMELAVQLAQVKMEFEKQHQADQEKQQWLEQSEARFKQEFERLAQHVFEEKVLKADRQNQESILSVLTPFREQLDSFKKQVTDNFTQEAKERHTLVHELRNLQQLNEQMAKEALNLTQALKGDNKQQGNWGEVVLARVLSESGLREGHEYHTQVSLQNEAGKRYQPDVVVYLPHNKQVVIDAKMTLVAYERYFHATEEADRAQAMREHLIAIRQHIKGLSQKDYQQLKGIETLDYVLMFIPVEGAFQAAIMADPQLVNQAMQHNIILVSPTTLLVALRTIDNLWRNERQNQNAQLIAERAARLYDKLRLVIDEMDDLGGALTKAQQHYQSAKNRLTQGRGNLVQQVEGFRQLGVEVKRPIATAWVEAAQEEEATQIPPLVERHPNVDAVN